MKCSNTLNRNWITVRCTVSALVLLRDVVGNLWQFFARARVLLSICANYRVAGVVFLIVRIIRDAASSRSNNPILWRIESMPFLSRHPLLISRSESALARLRRYRHPRLKFKAPNLRMGREFDRTLRECGRDVKDFFSRLNETLF